MAFSPRPPDLRRRPLATRASRSFARSPWSSSPRIRFLFIGPEMRSALPSARPSRVEPCASLRSLWPGSAGTFTPRSSPMLGAQAARSRPPAGRPPAGPLLHERPEHPAEPLGDAVDRLELAVADVPEAQRLSERIAHLEVAGARDAEAVGAVGPGAPVAFGEVERDGLH